MDQFDTVLINYAFSVLKQHPMTNLMVKIFLPKVHYQVFALVYAYFRWLDDQIDGDDLTAAEKKSLLARAYSLAKTSDWSDLQLPEKCLVEVLNYGDLNDLPVRSPIEQMTIAIDLDLKRVGKIPTEEDLQRLCQLRVCSYLNMLKILTKDSALMELPPNYGIACDEIHILRDIEEDFNRGIFNFSTEDVERFRLDTSSLSHPSWNTWYYYKVENSGALLKKGYANLLAGKPSHYVGMCLLNLLKYWKCWLDLKGKYRLDRK